MRKGIQYFIMFFILILVIFKICLKLYDSKIEVVITEKDQLENIEASGDKLDDAVIYVKIADKDEYDIHTTKVKDSTNVNQLISELNDITGWNITVVDYYSGKGGVTVIIKVNDDIFNGIEDKNQKLLIDSITKTIQYNFVSELGNPESLEVWIENESGEVLTNN